MKIALIPFSKSQLNNQLFDMSSSQNRDNVFEPYFVLKNYIEDQGVSINTNDINNIEESDRFIFLRLDLKLLIKLFVIGKLENSMYIQYEPPVIMDIHSEKNLRKISRIFGKTLTWNDDLVDDNKFFKFHFPMPKPQIYPYVKFEEKKLLVNISGYKLSNYPNELYSKRIEAIKFFEQTIPSEFDLYGVGWNGNEFYSYRGTVDSKLEVLQHYKFCLCYENISGMNGLLSEKIFDCFYAKSIPVFWGAENISEYIPEQCYIDKRKFATYDELLIFIKSMTAEEYGYRVNEINKYINSDQFKKFLPDSFAENVYSKVVGLEKPNSKAEQLLGILFLIYYRFINELPKKVNSTITRFLKRIGKALR